MVRWGLWYGQAYVIDNEHRCILLMAFWMHRDTVTRSWGPLLCHSFTFTFMHLADAFIQSDLHCMQVTVLHFISSCFPWEWNHDIGIASAMLYHLSYRKTTTITSCCSMIMHGPMLQGSVHNSWKLKTSQFLHGQHTHRTCHPLSMFGMLWIGVYDSVFQFLPISRNFTQLLKRSGPTFHRPQSTTWSTLCKGDGKWWSHQILTGFRTEHNPCQQKCFKSVLLTLLLSYENIICE